MEENKKTGVQSYPGSVPMIRVDGAKIRQLRENNKLTQLYLSTVVGVTTDTISRWENKRYQSVKLENAEKLAEALEVAIEDIQEQEEQTVLESRPPDAPPNSIEHPAKQRPRRFIILSVLLIVIALGILLYAMFPGQQQIEVSAERVLPPHVSPGQAFPVLIKIYSEEQTPVSLIIKELIPSGTHARQGLPAITSIDLKDNSLKWIRRIDSDESVYAYMCEVAANIGQKDQMVFNGTVTLKQNVSDRQTIKGASSLVVAPYHWADTNRDNMIDDEEILAVYDTYSDIEELPINRELIDSIWISSGYSWDSAKEEFITAD